MRQLFLRPADLQLQPWFLGLLALYAVVELSFNHRLLDLAGGYPLVVTAAELHGIEVWARVVAGLGLALLLMRWLARWFRSRLLLVVSCAAVGLLVMWHAQKAAIDAIVARADQADMLMSVRSYGLAGEAQKGRIQLRGEPMLEGPVPSALKPVFNALWASTVLGLTPDDLEATSGAAQLAGHWFFPRVSQSQMRDAYRRAVMTPVALGASLFFGLLNLCQLFAGMSVLLLKWLGRDDWLQHLRSWLLAAWVALCFSLSWWPGNAWVASPGYSQIARPALWQEKPFLALFVDWSLRAEPAWSDPVAWVHRELLRDFRFHHPWEVLLERLE